MASRISASKTRSWAEIRVSHVWLLSVEADLDDNARDHITIHLRNENKTNQEEFTFQQEWRIESGSLVPTAAEKS